MKNLKVVNVTKSCIICDTALHATRYLDRLKGLLAHSSLKKGEGLLLDPCNSVHCFGMRFTIDVVFISKKGQVLRCFPSMKPMRLSPLVFGARYALELPEGTIAATATVPGDMLIFENV